MKKLLKVVSRVVTIVCVLVDILAGACIVNAIRELRKNNKNETYVKFTMD